MPPKDTLLELKRNIRIELYNYFEGIKNEIDVSTQKALGLLEDSNTDVKVVELLDLNEKLALVVDNISRQSFAQVEDFFRANLQLSDIVSDQDSLDCYENDLKRKVLRGYCCFIPGCDLGFQSAHGVGVLVTSDWFMSQEEMDFVRADLEGDADKVKRTLKLKANHLTMHFSHKNSSIQDKLLDLSVIILKQRAQKQQQTELGALHLRARSIAGISSGAFVQFQNLKELDLSSNELGTLTRDTFNGLKALQILRLDDCHIKTIEADCFAKLTNLKTLSLTRNKLNSIYRGLFNGLENLKKLYLKGCSIKLIEKDTFKQLNSLQVLDLSSNLIRQIGESFFDGLNKLQKLDLTRCQLIKKIDPKAFSHLLELNEIDMPVLDEGVFDVASSLSGLLPALELVSLEMC